MGVAGESPFDFFEALLIAFEFPVRVGELLDKGDSGVGVGIVLIEPGLDGGFEYGGVFVGQHGFFGAAAVFERVQAGFGFAVRAARAGGAGVVGRREFVERIVHCGFRRELSRDGSAGFAREVVEILDSEWDGEFWRVVMERGGGGRIG
jgi:hypothetical protein